MPLASRITPVLAGGMQPPAQSITAMPHMPESKRPLELVALMLIPFILICASIGLLCFAARDVIEFIVVYGPV